MRRVVASSLAVALCALISSSARGDGVQYVTLALEERTTLRVSELAVLLIPPDRQYSVVVAGNVLVPVRRSRRRVLYRAVRPGLETIILRPNVSKGECVSCATHHYFVTVVSQRLQQGTPTAALSTKR